MIRTLSASIHKYGDIRLPIHPHRLRCAPCDIVQRLCLSHAPCRWGGSAASVCHRIYELRHLRQKLHGRHAYITIFRRHHVDTSMVLLTGTIILTGFIILNSSRNSIRYKDSSNSNGALKNWYDSCNT